MGNRIPDGTPVDLAAAQEIGLTESEYHHVESALGRAPTFAEAGVFSAMYSEHCSYKSSRHVLKDFPTTGPQVIQGPGENAGVVRIADGWGIAFKMESHNHPSFIEPYQGAATGVGGILRDVFTMGARPIASMNSLCFGNPNGPRTPAIVKGVVKGIGDYGNCVGVPTVAGQTIFHPSYQANPLVNAFTAGLVKESEIFKGYASGVGNIVVYLGAKTGRDGVHGATMASKEFNTEEEPDRPTVQVGDPFTEKLLLEATLEVMQKGLVVGIQDMGAAGLTSSSFEMADRAGTGLELDLDRIPTREPEMSAYELLLSESQERMLLVTEPSRWEAIREVFEKWDLHSEIIGTVVKGDRVQMTKDGKIVVDIPVTLVANPPRSPRPSKEPDFGPLWSWEESRLNALSLTEKLSSWAERIDFADPTPLTEQYDSMVGNRTVPSGSDGAILRLRDLGEDAPELALTVDCQPRVVRLDPREGGRRAVAECALNLACLGATPLAITDCLNFGSPENPEVMWSFEQAVAGMSEACIALEAPVVSGNVSFYNETDGKPIYPTPMVGMVGRRPSRAPRPSPQPQAGWDLFLAGPEEGALGGSAFLAQILGEDRGRPSQTDLSAVHKMVKFLTTLPSDTVFAVHDCSEGLVGATLDWLMCQPELGAQLVAGSDAFLFGETLPRVLVATPEGKRLEALATDIAWRRVGTLSADNVLTIGNEPISLKNLRESWKKRWTPFFA